MVTTPVIVVAAGSFDKERLTEHFKRDAEVRFAPIATPAEMAQATEGADALVVTLQPLRQDLIASIDGRVKVIGRAGVGLDTIDLEAARQAGITVINEPTYGTTEVACHGVAMLLALQRRLRALDSFVRGGWQGPLSLSPMSPIDEMTVGLIGCGRIGSAVAGMLGGIVGTVIAYDPLADALPAGVDEVDSLETLLARSDAVSLHLPLMPETAGLLSRDRLAAMRPGVLVVNVSRGGLIDEVALAEALHSGQVGGAALDVFATEPLPADSPLLDAPNTLFSPHVAAYSERSSWRLASWTIEDTLSWIASRDVQHGNLVVKGER
jgi:D-3-phosphoglycerate dehydrogenase / 2-oxoglutarate reductase